jgi:hypothetical protein
MNLSIIVGMGSRIRKQNKPLYREGYECMIKEKKEMEEEYLERGIHIELYIFSSVCDLVGHRKRFEEMIKNK